MGFIHRTGHDVPEAVIRRRFDQGWNQLQTIYRSLADVWQVYDSSGERPVLIDDGGSS
jgi:predicted ABC-type ATPase